MLKITKMADGTYKAWQIVVKERVETYEVIQDADGETPEEAFQNYEKKYKLNNSQSTQIDK